MRDERTKREAASEMRAGERRREEEEERRRGGDEDTRRGGDKERRRGSFILGPEVSAKNKNPTLRMWGKHAPPNRT